MMEALDSPVRSDDRHAPAGAAPASDVMSYAGTDAEIDAQIDSACRQACEAIAPAWPLDRAIAVNPHWSRIGMPVRRVAARMAVLGGIQVFPPRDRQLHAWEQGRISLADLEHALRQVPDAQGAGLT